MPGGTACENVEPFIVPVSRLDFQNMLCSFYSFICVHFTYKYTVIASKDMIPWAAKGLIPRFRSSFLRVHS